MPGCAGTPALSNAIKYTPRNGAVNLDIKTEDQHVVITCADTGVGIERPRLDALFELEENKSTRGTDNEKGTGLGLMVAKEFVQLNKGDMRIESIPGQGTTVMVRLPRSL